VCWRWVAVDDDFQQLQDSYCERHCAMFDNTAENKLEYTRIFEGYVRAVCERPPIAACRGSGLAAVGWWIGQDDRELHHRVFDSPGARHTRCPQSPCILRAAMIVVHVRGWYCYCCCADAGFFNGGVCADAHCS
jgi:hypothetical protein